MPLLLPSIIANSTRPPQSFIIAQSSTSHSCLPLVQGLLTASLDRKNTSVFLFCFLYAPSSLTKSRSPSGLDNLHVFDWTYKVPGYDDATSDPLKDLTTVIAEVDTPGSIDVIVDSIDTLLSDAGSQSTVYNALYQILTTLHSKSSDSRLILHTLSPCPLLAPLTQTRFSSNLVHLIAHPPVVLSNLSTAYLTPPPPLSSPEKFWSVFTPFSERSYESETLVFGSEGEGSAGSEIVVEVLVRGVSDKVIGTGRRRSVERVLEGWLSVSGLPCELKELESLKGLWLTKAVAETATPDPTQNISFNLQLTRQQQESRAQVALPYAHEGKPALSHAATILYDPDSADDIDDDDPDEDLDL